MKRILIFICFMLLISTLSLNSITASANLVSNSQESIEGYIDAETVSRENLDKQILDINSQIQILNTNATNLGDPEVSEISDELSTINFEEMVYDQVDLFQQEALSIAVENDLTNSETTSSEESIQAEVDEEVITEVEYDYDINDLPEIELIDTNVSLSIIEETNLDTYTSNELPLFNTYLKLRITPTDTGIIKNPITTQPIGPVPMSMPSESLTSTQNQVSAASGGLGWFTTAESTYAINPGTKNAKLVTQVSVFSSGGKIKPKSYTMNLAHYTATTRAGLYSLVRSTRFTNVSLFQTKKIDSPITKSYFWKGGANITGHFTNGQVKTEKFSRVLLLNKKGVKYPSFTDPVSKKVMTEPASTTWVRNPINKWTSTNLSNYRKWYNSTYRTLSWTGNYEVHHIRPLKYAGSNSNSNLIPLTVSFHRKTVSPWWTNY